jgi:hypothetical protein
MKLQKMPLIYQDAMRFWVFWQAFFFSPSQNASTAAYGKEKIGLPASSLLRSGGRAGMIKIVQWFMRREAIIC